MVDYANATLSVLTTLAIPAIVIGIGKVSEFNAHKKDTGNTFTLIRKEADEHELRDANRHKEILDRITRMENLVIQELRNNKKN